MKLEEPHPEHRVSKVDFHNVLTYYKTITAQKSVGVELMSEGHEREGNQMVGFSPCLARL